MAAVGIDIGREAITWGLEESRSDPRKHLHFLRFCKHCPSGQAFETKLTIGSAHIVRQGKPSRQSSQLVLYTVSVRASLRDKAHKWTCCESKSIRKHGSGLARLKA